MFQHFLTLFLLLLCSSATFSANILYVSAIASPSHHIWNQALAFGLVNKGHNVTYISPDEDKSPKLQNYSQILLEGVYDDLHENYNFNDLSSNSPTKMLLEFQTFCVYACQQNLKTKGLQKLLNYPSEFRFDLIIFDVTAGSCLYPLIKRFNYPPTIGVTAFSLPTFVSYNFGNSLFSSYIPFSMLPYTTRMSFSERIWNSVFTYVDTGLRYLYLYTEEYKMAKKVFGDNIPPMDELERHISLVLANTDPLLDYPQPVPPNIISVGGLHTRKSKEIPQDLQHLLDTAQNGVIIFSLGTNVRSDKLNKETQEAILNAFSEIKETVIWKFESDINNLPKNVLIRKWLPQNDLLGHHNVKLFIGHGGALSTQESIFHGVPMVTIPFFADQHLNTKILVEKKIGVSVDLKHITAEYFLKKIREVLDNPMYARNMKKLSQRFRDRTETPLERGIFWIEYVMRHGTADFLSTSARDLPFYKSSGMDVLALLVLFICSLIFILYKLIRLIFKSFHQKKKIKTQ